MRHTIICALLFAFTACDSKEAVEVKPDDEKADEKSDEKSDEKAEAKTDEKKEGKADEKKADEKK